MCYALCCALIPGTDVMCRKAEDGSRQLVHATAVVVILIPQITHWGVAITDVDRGWGDDDAFHRSAVGSEHQVVSAEIEMLNGQGIQRQKLAVYARRERCAIEK